MNFDTFVKDTEEVDIQAIKKELKKSVLISELKECDKTKLIKAIEASGGKTTASRYGLNEEIVFADSELMSAYERKKDNRAQYLKYRFDFKYYPLNHKLAKFPLVVAVEASGRCNLRCSMCFQKNMDKNNSSENKNIMEWSTYQKFLDELDQETLYSIVFASRGEPLLNPKIGKMIKAAKDKGVLDIKLNTNATLLTEEKGRELLDSGLDLLVFSVDSVDPENYKKIRGTNLDVVLNNINRFMEIKRTEYPESKMKVRVAMVLTNGTKDVREEEIQKAQEYWTGRVDELSIKTENDFAAVYECGKKKEIAEACSLLWERVYLWSDGSVNPCDIDHLSTMCLGNINKGETIKSIWTSKKLENLRKFHEFNKCEIDTVCKNCVGY